MNLAEQAVVLGIAAIMALSMFTLARLAATLVNRLHETNSNSDDDPQQTDDTERERDRLDYRG